MGCFIWQVCSDKYVKIYNLLILIREDKQLYLYTFIKLGQIIRPDN